MLDSNTVAILANCIRTISIALAQLAEQLTPAFESTKEIKTMSISSVDSETLFKKFQELCSTGCISDVKKLLQKNGFSSLAEVPPEKYDTLYNEAINLIKNKH